MTGIVIKFNEDWDGDGRFDRAWVDFDNDGTIDAIQIDFNKDNKIDAEYRRNEDGDFELRGTTEPQIEHLIKDLDPDYVKKNVAYRETRIEQDTDGNRQPDRIFVDKGSDGSFEIYAERNSAGGLNTYQDSDGDRLLDQQWNDQTGQWQSLSTPFEMPEIPEVKFDPTDLSDISGRQSSSGHDGGMKGWMEDVNNDMNSNFA